MISTEPGKPINSWKRLDGVDVLRSLAILFVLLNHVNMRLWLAHVAYTKGLPHQLISSLVWNGQRGVQIFFVVSGFLITSTSLRRWGALSEIKVFDFWRLRFARIAPLLFLLLIVLSGLHFAGAKDFVVSQKTGGIGRALLAAVTFHVNVLEARRGYLPANWDILWSLSVEETFYLFFPLIARWLGRSKFLIVLLCAFVVLGPFGRTVLASGNPVWHEYSYLGGMDAIALGCLTALLVSRIKYSLPALRKIGSFGALVVAGCLCFTVRLDSWGLQRSGLDMSILALGTCTLIIFAAQTRWQGPGLLRPLLKLGECSYEVYLTHMFVVFAFFKLFVSIGKPMFAVPALFIVAIVISGLLGSLVARFYSEPINHFLRRNSEHGEEKVGTTVTETIGG